jgi:mRNA interferase MazF
VRRGDLVTVRLPGDFGKPRPALVIQADLFDALPTVAVLPLTAALLEASLLRVSVLPEDGNGLRQHSHVMIDKPHTVRRSRVGAPIGRLDDAAMVRINRALAAFLGFA